MALGAFILNSKYARYIYIYAKKTAEIYIFQHCLVPAKLLGDVRDSRCKIVQSELAS